MKNYLIYFLLITLSIIVNSCSEGFKEEYLKINIVLKEVTEITTPTTDTTPDYTFSSTESGTLTYGGSCSSSTTSAISGNNTITLNTLSVGTYADCTITVSKTMTTNKSETTLSGSLTITSFTVSSSDNTTTSSSTQMGGSIQGTELDLSTAVTTLAGQTGVAGSTDHATGTSASFNFPYGITTDGTNLYVVSVVHKIRKIVIDNGTVTTLAGTGSEGSTDHATGTSASFNRPQGITTDGTNLYVADQFNHRIRKIVIDNGTVTTLAGTGSTGSTDHATGTSASFNKPSKITTDGTNLYVTDFRNHKIRKIVIDNGTVTTLAGSSSAGFADNATGTSAKFNQPEGITTDGTNLYVADYGNDRIRKIVISTGVVTTLAGSSSGYTDHNTGTSASFDEPYDVTTDGTNLYVVDYGNDRIRKIVIDNGTVTTLAGTGSEGSTDHATGTSASFNRPQGITTDGTNLYVSDTRNMKIRKIE